eukprot:g18100.t1
MKYYADHRRKTDLDDMRREMFEHDSKLRSMTGKDRDVFFATTYRTFRDRYPAMCVNFTESRLGMTYAQQVGMIETFDKMHYTEWEQSKDWQKWKSLLLNAGNVAQDMLGNAWPISPQEMKITWVTGIFDLGRNKLGAQDLGFKRDFSMYLDALKRFVGYKGYDKIIFTEQWIIDEVEPALSAAEKKTVKWIAMTLQDVRDRLPGEDTAALIDKIRTSPEWRAQADWLGESPQAKLEMYNKLVMNKPFFIADAARLNPFGATHFLWIDVKHNCLSSQFTPDNDWPIRAHMLDQYVLTYFNYGPAGEVHGFRGDKFAKMCGIPPHDRHPVKVVRGGILGGPRALCIAVELLYKIALRASLKLGVMGTEENILSLLLYNIPDVFAPFSNDDACKEQLEGDHACKGKTNPSGNCAIFDWVYNGPSDAKRDPNYNPNGGDSQWGRPYETNQRICLYENGNWLMLFSEKECKEEEGGKWLNMNRGFEGMGECVDNGLSFSWDERVNCQCYPNPCPLENSPGDCFHKLPGCLDGKCSLFFQPKGKACGSNGRCDGEGRCIQ